jgi:hypothetical protein
MKKAILPVLLATIWIGASEFLRNEFILKAYWTAHYEKLGQVFPSAPINGAIWGIWSLCLAIFIYLLNKKYKLLQTTLLAWFAGFVLMWLVIGNLNVLPFGILPLAVPLSLFEAFLASYIINRLSASYQNKK